MYHLPKYTPALACILFLSYCCTFSPHRPIEHHRQHRVPPLAVSRHSTPANQTFSLFVRRLLTSLTPSTFTGPAEPASELHLSPYWACFRTAPKLTSVPVTDLGIIRRRSSNHIRLSCPVPSQTDRRPGLHLIRPCTSPGHSSPPNVFVPGFSPRLPFFFFCILSRPIFSPRSLVLSIGHHQRHNERSLACRPQVCFTFQAHLS